MTVANTQTINAAEQQAKAIKSKASQRAGKSKATEKEIQQAQTRKALRPSVRVVNNAMDKYMALRAKSDDARLVAAVVISTANEQCKDCGLSFKSWCEENLKHSWETIRKLIPIGDAERKEPGAGKAMLDAAREKNAKANSELRARKAAEQSKKQENPKGAKKDPVNVIKAMLELMSPDDQLRVAEHAAKLCGLQFTTPELATVASKPRRRRATKKAA